VLPIGDVDRDLLEGICGGIRQAYPHLECAITGEGMEVPREAYNPARNQYNSTTILHKMRRLKDLGGHLILGVTNVDLYVPQLNFVFGEAECPGRVAVISLYRLRPEFYGAKPDRRLLLERAVKEAVHEVGHNLGLTHCINPACVMHFSNNIWMTDAKGSKPCIACRMKLKLMMRRRGH